MSTYNYYFIKTNASYSFFFVYALNLDNRLSLIDQKVKLYIFNLLQRIIGLIDGL